MVFNGGGVEKITVSTTTPAISKEVVSLNTGVKERVKEYFANDPVMAKVAWCESRNRQFETDGSVFRGKINNNDVGVMQINTIYHEKTAEKMKIDLMTLEGNLKYAKYLYEREGTRPWNSSSGCWANETENQVVLK